MRDPLGTGRVTPVNLLRYLYLKLPVRRADFAEACLALTPKVSCVGPHLYLEISATQNYFGGFEGWLNRFESLRALYENEIPFEGVVVDRPEWGPALSPGLGRDTSRTGRVTPGNQSRLLVLPPGQSQAALFSKNLPALLLCGDPATFEKEEKDRQKLIAFLKRLGLYTVGDFARLAPEAVIRRFGKSMGQLHAQLHGTRPLCLPPFEPENRLLEAVDAEEAAHQEGLVCLMQTTLVKMEARLLGRAALAKKITFTFLLENGTRQKELFLTEPSRCSNTLLKLFSEWLNGLKWDSPLKRVGVEISDTIAQGSRQLHLFDDEETRAADLQNYLERLRHRLGGDRAGFVRLKDDHRPEKTWEVVAAPVQPAKPREFYPPRPLYLFSPRPFAFNADLWRLVPTEKLTTGWWNGEAPRHYFLAYGPNEKRLWIFQKNEEWYLHGEFC